MLADFGTISRTPWGREGTMLDEHPHDLDGALAKAGLNFEVEVEEAYRKLANGEFKAVPRSRFTVRTDKDRVLGTVGRIYTPLQNVDAFNVLRPMLDSGVASLATAGAVRSGRDVWVGVQFNRDKMASENETIGQVFDDLGLLPYAVIINNHAGQRKVVAMETSIRIWCGNTLRYALGQRATGARSIAVRHDAQVEANITVAVEVLWGDLIGRFGRMAEQYAKLRAANFEKADFRAAVLDVLSPLPEKPKNLTKPEARRFDGRIAKAERRRDRLVWLWENGDGHTGDGSAWEALNGAVQSLDHDREYWGNPKGGVVTGLLGGTLGDRKQAVTEAVAKLAHAVR